MQAQSARSALRGEASRLSEHSHAALGMARAKALKSTKGRRPQEVALDSPWSAVYADDQPVRKASRRPKSLVAIRSRTLAAWETSSKRWRLARRSGGTAELTQPPGVGLHSEVDALRAGSLADARGSTRTFHTAGTRRARVENSSPQADLAISGLAMERPAGQIIPDKMAHAERVHPLQVVNRRQ